MRRLFLFDGTGLTYRAFYALDQSLSNSAGLPTNATYGVARMLIKFMKDYFKSGEVFCAFAMDKKTVTYRHKLLEEYKAQRPPTPDILLMQIPYVKKLASAFGFKVIEVENFEADDAIATLAVKGRESFDEVYIVSGDKDFLQLVDDRIKLLRVVKGLSSLKLYDPQKVREEYGVEPAQIRDYLALVGDTADNVPGVKGIGPKKATDLLKKFGSVEGIVKNIRALPPSLRRTVMDGRQMMELSKKLVTLVLDVPVSTKWEEYEYKGIMKEKLLPLLKELEFSSIMDELDLSDETFKFDVEIVNDEDKLKNLIENMKNASSVCFDLETTSLDPHEAEIVGLSIACNPGKGYYIPFHTFSNKDRLLDEITNVLFASRLVGQNLKYDYSVLMKKGYEPPDPHFDTLIAAHLLNPNERRYKLDDLARKYLGYKMVSYGEMLSSSMSGNIKEVPVEKIAFYSVEDAVVTYNLYEIFNRRLYEEELLDAFEKIEMPLIKVLARMELNGVYVDTQYLKELSKKYEDKLNDIASQIYQEVGETFNLNSPRQVANILYGKLGLKPSKKTKGGDYSTNAEVLESLAEENEVARKILEYRKYQKLKSTYVDALPNLVNPHTGRIHTSFNQTGTATGRLSSSEPNMQNLPKRDENSRLIRKAIVPQHGGWKILSADYSQIELRVLAHLSEDENLIEAFKEGKDIHTLTAARIFGVDEKEVTEKMRNVGKMVNFAIIYGVTPYGLAIRTGLSNEEARNVITNYFKSFPKVREYLQKTIDHAKKSGYVRTMFGRRRDIPQLRAKNRNVVQEGERMAVNTPIQGTAADIIKLAMIEIDKQLLNKKTMMILQVHDELVFEVAPEELDEICNMVRNIMESAVKLRVPLKVDMEIGDHWS